MAAGHREVIEHSSYSLRKYSIGAGIGGGGGKATLDKMYNADCSSLWNQLFVIQVLEDISVLNRGVVLMNDAFVL